MREVVNVRQYRPAGTGDDGKRLGRMVTLPPLDIARQQFEQAMRSFGVIEWKVAPDER